MELKILILALFLAFDAKVQSELLKEEDQIPKKVTVPKCCDLNEIMVEIHPNIRMCKKRKNYLHIDIENQGIQSSYNWEPAFFDDNAHEVAGPREFAIMHGTPFEHGNCNKRGEILYPVVHDRKNGNEMMLFENGTLSHRMVLKNGEHKSDRYYYDKTKYCLDDLIVTHNITFNNQNGTKDEPIKDFAYICIDQSVDLQSLIDHYFYPISLSVSMMCFILTFLLYSFLPQLRDLTGKFILGICLCLCVTFASLLVKQFGLKDSNVEQMWVEVVLHSSIVGVWFCLSSMGHHVWNIIRSKSVFTRVTDGQRLRYYSAYIIIMTIIVTTIAVCIHFYVEEKQEVGQHKLGLFVMASFYAPVIIIIFANLVFYWQSQRIITQQLIYNRGMQHFQQNFDLFTKFLIVIGIWTVFQTMSLLDMDELRYIGMVFNLLQGPFIFAVAMCRTRVAFLFKKYFCHDSCCFGFCKSEEFINEECEELATIEKLKSKAENGGAEIAEYLQPFIQGPSNDKEMSKSLFNMKNREPGEIPPPANPEMPVGRIKRLLKSNSLTAITNINFGWRKETAV